MPPADLTDVEMAKQCRAARRLARLFRIERSDRFERWPFEARQKLVQRRNEMIDDMLRAEKMWRAQTGLAPSGLGDALQNLMREIGRLQPIAEARVAALAEQLHPRGGINAASGFRQTGGGQLLGRG